MNMVHFIPPCQRRLAMSAAQDDSTPALIYGANGTGKSAIARWIHGHGPRAAFPFIAASPDQPLAECMKLAQGGTLLISEISEWPMGAQKQLLDYLVSHAIVSAESSDVKMLLRVRIIATASHSLESRARAGLFNSELLEKLNVTRIEMPALSQRCEEFEDIVLGILGEITHALHKEYLREISKEAWRRLQLYNWPGNIRELRNVLNLAALAAEGDRIETTHLPAFENEQADFLATREQFEKVYLLELKKNTQMSHYGISSENVTIL